MCAYAKLDPASFNFCFIALFSSSICLSCSALSAACCAATFSRSANSSSDSEVTDFDPVWASLSCKLLGRVGRSALDGGVLYVGGEGYVGCGWVGVCGMWVGRGMRDVGGESYLFSSAIFLSCSAFSAACAAATRARSASSSSDSAVTDFDPVWASLSCIAVFL